MLVGETADGVRLRAYEHCYKREHEYSLFIPGYTLTLNYSPDSPHDRHISHARNGDGVRIIGTMVARRLTT